MCLSLQAQKDVMFLHFVAKILKDVVPLIEHPSESFLAGLEEDLVKLIMKQGQLVWLISEYLYTKVLTVCVSTCATTQHSTTTDSVCNYVSSMQLA